MDEDIQRIDTVHSQIIDGSVHVHKHVGPGILEGGYHKCLIIELQYRGLKVRL